MSEDVKSQPVPPSAPSQGAFRVAGLIIRMIMLIPVISTFVAALGLFVYGGIETIHFVRDLFSAEHPLSRDEALLLAIEIVDLFLLATVVQVVSLGLYQLYFNQDLQLPKWLKIETLDDLKSKLVGVTITVVAVYFLGQAIVWESGADIANLGIGISLVIASLTYFLSKIDHKD